MTRPGTVALFLLAAACVAPLPHATVDDATRAQARWPEASVATLEAGRRLFADRCSGCHALRLPSEYPAARWPALLSQMEKEAKLAPEERELIERFVLTVAARPQGDAGPPRP